jgi:hypothetical protein
MGSRGDVEPFLATATEDGVAAAVDLLEAC